ncbi:MAG TPA: c(7)-type cytochrome triheme domain-containing protein [Geopsychrobacteraceae bacterium]|jgi:c(7)-type cytochrome triheme protein
MRKRLVLAVVLLLCVAVAAVAVPPGKTLEFTKSALGTVTFSGDIHQAAGVTCKECHNAEMFPKMKQGTVEIKMSAIYAGQLCGTCHNGERAFEAKKNCIRCHKR